MPDLIDYLGIGSGLLTIYVAADGAKKSERKKCDQEQAKRTFNDGYMRTANMVTPPSSDQNPYQTTQQIQFQGFGEAAEKLKNKVFGPSKQTRDLDRFRNTVNRHGSKGQKLRVANLAADSAVSELTSSPVSLNPKNNAKSTNSPPSSKPSKTATTA